MSKRIKISTEYKVIGGVVCTLHDDIVKIVLKLRDGYKVIDRDLAKYESFISIDESKVNWTIPFLLKLRTHVASSKILG